MKKIVKTFWHPLSFWGVVSILGTLSCSATAQPTNTVQATVPITNTGLVGIGVTKDNNYVYVVGANAANALYVINAQTNQVAPNTIPLGGDPQFLAITPNGNEVYVANVVSPYDGINAVPGTVSLIVNAQSGTPALKQVIPGMGQCSWRIGINPKGTEAWVTNQFDSDITVIDLKNNHVTPIPIQVGDRPSGVAFTPNGKRAFVTNLTDNTVLEINTASKLIVGRPIAVGNVPTDIVITPSGNKAYVSNEDGTISVIDTANRQVTSTVRVSPSNTAYELGIALTPDGKYLYAPNQNARTVVMVSTATDTIVGNPINVGFTPGVIAMAPNGKHAYVTNLFDGTVSVIEISGD